MLKNMLMVVAISTVAASAFAAPPSSEKVGTTIPMKDGATLYILKDGNMAMEDKTGHAVSMKHDEVMETEDGRKIMMHGNEVMQLEKILHKDHAGN